VLASGVAAVLVREDPSTSPNGQERGRIIGRVLDLDGRPVAGAEVALHRRESNRQWSEV
jgi:protocatechuate 3,4-dioxygenase beta subunit